MILIIILILGFIYIYYELNTLRVTHYNIESSKIKKFNNYKIIQISDFHNIKSVKLKSNIINNIIKEKPDIIVITGDILNSRNVNVNITLEFIKRLLEITKVYYVTGNHERRIRTYKRIEESLIEMGVNVLKNKKEILKKDNEIIELIGIDDSTFFKTKKEFYSTLDNLIENNDNYKVLLSHKPDYFKEYVKNNVDLTLCGHTHNGQIALPFIGGIYAPGQGLFPKYLYGLYKEGNSNMIVSAGIGTSSVKIRTFNKPELVVIHLKKLNK